jgi:L-amino acid N-acyltransferase YncA
MDIVDATEADLEQITYIYNDAVLNTTAIWNDALVDVTNRRAWLQQRCLDGYPVLGARRDVRDVLGYASFATLRAFDGYRFTVENSLYVRADARRSGVGRALLLELLERARRLRKHCMIAGIESTNVSSIALHESLGFRQVGLLPQVGCKFGRWLDLALLGLDLDGRQQPEPAIAGAGG